MSDDETRPSAHGGRPEAARATWSPYEPALRRRARPAWIEAAKRSAIGALVAVVLALLGREEMSVVVASISLALVALAALVPGAYRALDRLVIRASGVVGRVLAYALLTPVFFLVMTPLGWILRRGPRARWRSGRDASATSYWKPRDPRPPRLDRPF